MTETFKGQSYEIVAWARDQRVMYYRSFGGYQGEWLLLSKGERDYFLYKGSYGSCSGCDSWEAWGNSEPTKEQAQEFVKDYPSFAEVPIATMQNLALNRTIEKILPANMRGDFTQVGWEQVAADWSALVRLEESLPVETVDILGCSNQETKRQLLERFGVERFVTESKGTWVERSGEDGLLSVDADHRFLWLKDSSTARRYLLRVPPETESVQAGKAWSFNLAPSKYAP